MGKKIKIKYNLITLKDIRDSTVQKNDIFGILNNIFLPIKDYHAKLLDIFTIPLDNDKSNFLK